MAQDAAQLVLETLQADVDFCDLVVGGASNILETGDMLVSVLNDAEETRRSVASTDVLGVSVQDDGETHVRGNIFRQAVVVRALDRQNGFNAIRAVRFAAIALIDKLAGALDEGGVVSFIYQSRSGHKVDVTYNVDFEAIRFAAITDKEEN